MECIDFEPSIIQDNRILRLCKRLNKFTLDEITTIAEDINEATLELALMYLVNEKRIIKKGNIYNYYLMQNDYLL